MRVRRKAQSSGNAAAWKNRGTECKVVAGPACAACGCQGAGAIDLTDRCWYCMQCWSKFQASPQPEQFCNTFGYIRFVRPWTAPALEGRVYTPGVQVVGLPGKLCTESMLEVICEQALVNFSFIKCETYDTSSGTSVGKALLKFPTWPMVQRFMNHVHGCAWKGVASCARCRPVAILEDATDESEEIVLLPDGGPSSPCTKPPIRTDACEKATVGDEIIRQLGERIEEEERKERMRLEAQSDFLLAKGGGLDDLHSKEEDLLHTSTSCADTQSALSDLTSPSEVSSSPAFGSQAEMSADGSHEMEEPLPAEWQRVWSEEHDKHYYWHVPTGRVTWNAPAHEAHFGGIATFDPFQSEAHQDSEKCTSVSGVNPGELSECQTCEQGEKGTLTGQVCCADQIKFSENLKNFTCTEHWWPSEGAHSCLRLVHGEQIMVTWTDENENGWAFGHRITNPEEEGYFPKFVLEGKLSQG